MCLHVLRQSGYCHLAAVHKCHISEKDCLPNRFNCEPGLLIMKEIITKALSKKYKFDVIFKLYKVLQSLHIKSFLTDLLDAYIMKNIHTYKYMFTLLLLSSFVTFLCCAVKWKK